MPDVAVRAARGCPGASTGPGGSGPGSGSGLLVHTDHDRVLGWFQVQAHDVADFRVQLRVGGELEALGAVRLQAEPAPQTVIESWLTLMPLAWCSQSASRRLDQWVSPAVPQRLRRGHRRGQDLAHHLIGQHPPRAAWARRVLQPGQPGLGVLAPLDHRRLGAARPLSDLRADQPVRGQQHDPGPLHHPGRGPVRTGSAAPAPPGQHRAPSEHASDWACTIVSAET